MFWYLVPFGIVKRKMQKLEATFLACPRLCGVAATMLSELIHLAEKSATFPQ